MTADLELQERLGHGDLAEVWKAFDPQVQHYVAVKLFDADLLNDPAFMTFYQNLPRLPEAQRILALQHPNIVRLHGFHITPSSEAEKPVAYRMSKQVLRFTIPAIDDYEVAAITVA